MAKLVRLEPIGKETCVATNTTLLSSLLAEDIEVTQGCGGRGLCATCHVYVKAGQESLSPLSAREQRTLGVVTSCHAASRLACQALIQGDNIVVELPSGMYLTQTTNIEDLIGRRTKDEILDPMTGKVLIEAQKLITRSMLAKLDDAREQFNDYLSRSRSVSA